MFLKAIDLLYDLRGLRRPIHNTIRSFNRSAIISIIIDCDLCHSIHNIPSMARNKKDRKNIRNVFPVRFACWLTPRWLRITAASPRIHPAAILVACQFPPHDLRT
jgi:TusA-related sulfurtransferase